MAIFRFGISLEKVLIERFDFRVAEYSLDPQWLLRCVFGDLRGPRRGYFGGPASCDRRGRRRNFFSRINHNSSTKF